MHLLEGDRILLEKALEGSQTARGNLLGSPTNLFLRLGPIVSGVSEPLQHLNGRPGHIRRQETFEHLRGQRLVNHLLARRVADSLRNFIVRVQFGAAVKDLAFVFVRVGKDGGDEFARISRSVEKWDAGFVGGDVGNA